MSFSFMIVSLLTFVSAIFFFLLLMVPHKIGFLRQLQSRFTHLKVHNLCRVVGFIGLGLCILVIAFYLRPHSSTRNMIGHYYFSKYLKNRPSEEDDLLTTKAFTLWSHTGDVQSFVEASQKLPPDSPLWSRFLWLVERGYKRKGIYNQYGTFLHGLESKITHPNAKATLIFKLAQFYHDEDQEKASSYYNKIIEENVDPFLVELAQGNLHEMNSLNEGQNAPELHVTDIKGKGYSNATLHGKFVILLFWDVECPGCRKEMAIYKRIYSSNQSDKLIILGISVENEKKTYQFIQREELKWPQVVLKREIFHEIQKQFNIQYFPSNYVIGPSGKILARQLPGNELEERIKELIEQPQDL